MPESADVWETIRAARVVPVVVAEGAEHGRGLAEALVAGGIPIAEVTLRRAGALDLMTALSRDERVVVGAGTVTRPDQVDDVVAAGARFVVSPGLSVDVVRRCQALAVPVLPGVATPSDVMAALALGLEAVKLFPAEPLGGLRYLRSLAAPFVGLKFVPTGGISLDTSADYLAEPSVAAVGGSWMVPAAAISAGRYDDVARLCAATVDRCGPVDTPAGRPITS